MSLPVEIPCQLLSALPVSEIFLLFLWVSLPCGLGWVCISHPLTAELDSPQYEILGFSPNRENVSLSDTQKGSKSLPFDNYI